MSKDRLTTSERWGLIIPALGALVFGLMPYLAPLLFGYFIGYLGNYPYIYQIAGAANLGYLVGLYVAILTGNYRSTKFIILATLVFNLAAFYATLTEMYRHRATPAVYVVSVVTVIIILICGRILRKHGLSWGKGQLSAWASRALSLSVLSALIFGVVPLIPRLFVPIFGYGGVDAGMLKIAGAATLGYALMGIYELRSKDWAEIYWPLWMGLTFNGLAFIASILQLYKGQSNLLIWLVTVASGFFAVSFCSILLRRGR